jgi:hypothetical protein
MGEKLQHTDGIGLSDMPLGRGNPERKARGRRERTVFAIIINYS